METKEKLKKLRGWFPKDPYVLDAGESGKGKSSISAYIVGYGVGIGICEFLIILIDTLGWGNIESNLSPALSMLSGMLVGVPCVILGVEIGAKLSKKLKKRWVSEQAGEP